MHIVIGLITAIAGLIWALNSLQKAGVDLNAFNPFTWARRRKWEKKLGTKPIHGLTDSMDAAALLVVAVVKEEGEITRDTKLEVLSLFEKEFGIERSKSIEMFSSSTYMLKDIMNIAGEVPRVLKPSKDAFSPEHVEKLIDMLHVAAKTEGEATESQSEIVSAVEKAFNLNTAKPSEW